MKKPGQSDLNDIELFRTEIGDIEQIEYDKIIPNQNNIKATVRSKQHRFENTLKSHFSEDFLPSSVGSEETLSFRRSGIQERLLSRLRNGQLKMEAELDLHGMTIPVAHQALAEFIADCQHYQIRCARIIHGKGWGSKNHKPILKTKLNGWLREIDSVLAFCSARIEDGGTGALYILLRRTNKKNKSAN